MIYLDNAATTFPKPECVIKEVRHCIRDYCGNPGRGSHSMALAAAAKIYECREEAADLLGLPSPEGVVFTLNTTYALNIAIKSLAKDGDHFLTSDLEHNSVLRPLTELRRRGKITFDIFSSSGDTADIINSIEPLIKRETRALICTAASNIANIILPLREIGALCRRRHIKFIVDAAQAAGVYNISMDAMNIDMLCVPSHKGLFGIQGSGMLLTSCTEGLATVIEGGSGVNSLETSMPDFLPDRLEAGTMPTPAIVGLLEGIKWVKGYSADVIHDHEVELWNRVWQRIGDDPYITVYNNNPGSVILFNLRTKSSSAAVAALDYEGICVRGGLHCAPLAHKTLGTPEGGAIRASFSPMNTMREIDKFLDILYRISRDN